MAAPKKYSSNKTSVKTQKQAEASIESAFQNQTEAMDKNSSRYKAIEAHHEKTLGQLDSIYQKIKLTNDLTTEQTKAAKKAVGQYAEHKKLQADLAQQVKDRVVSEEQAKRILNKSRAEFDGMVRSAKLTNKESATLRKELKGMSQEMDLAAKAFDRTEKKAQLLNAAMDQFGSSNIPMMREFSQVLQGIATKDLAAVRMALTAAGAAAAVLAKSYLFPEMKAAQDVENEVKQIKTDNIADIAKIENKRGFIIAKKELERSKNRIETENTVNSLINDANFASQKAAIQFSAQLQTGAAEFKAAAKTALYGKGIGSIGYGAAQMQLAGVGAENVAASLTTATKTLGTKVSSDFAADMSVLEKRTGQSSENISGMVSFFKRMGKLTNESALNMTEGMRAMADSAGIDLGGYMEEVAQASKEALGYQIKSGPALQKQVAYAQQLGVSFGDIAKAGKNMVLNYKDSIKSEMSLSAMLGKNVNLSEARALFAQGKTDDALKSIKAQGLDPSKMNMFQQEALSKALGGLDLDTIQKIATGSATDVSAQTGNVKAGNKGFLKTTQSAQSTLASQTASISANTAVIDAQLSGKITDAYLNSKEYLRYQASLITLEKQQTVLNQKEELAFKRSGDYLTQLISTAKNNIENLFSKDNFATLGVGLAGGLAGNLLGKGIEKLFGGVQKVEVVNMSDSGLTDMLDSDGPKKRGRKPGRPRTSRTKIPKTKIGRAKAVLQEGVSLVKDFFSKTKSNVNIPKDVKTMTKVANNPATKSALKNTKGLSTLTKLAPKLAKFTKFGGPAMNVLMAGADYKMRKDEGQTTTQAAVGTGAGLVGALAGAKGGALVGASIGALFGGVGAVPGAFLGGLIGGAGGYFLASSAADYATGVGKTPSTVKQSTKGASSVSVPGGATAAKPSSVLSDVQYQTRLQMKMVELLGVNAALLQSIATDGGRDKSINLNGVKLNQSLMVNLRKQMAVNRRETIGAPTGMV